MEVQINQFSQRSRPQKNEGFVPNNYVSTMEGELSKWCYYLDEAISNKGKWREEAFGLKSQEPLDVEIGTGNGFFFAHYASTHKDRAYLGFEIKYKPLIQSIRRALREGAQNARICKAYAQSLKDIFEEGEVNNIFIHYPDPWPKRKHAKNRLIQVEFINQLYRLQRPGSFLEFKTDHFEYFKWAYECFKQTPYKIIRYTEDLHNSSWADENFKTHFEKLWQSKGLKAHMIRLEKAN